MRVVDHIATTTDCWSVRRRRFIGVTVHWIDPDSLTRYSAALAHSWKVRTHSMCWQTPWMISIPSLKFVVRFWEQIMVLISEKLSRFLEKMRRTMQSKVMVMHLKRERMKRGWRGGVCWCVSTSEWRWWLWVSSPLSPTQPNSYGWSYESNIQWGIQESVPFNIWKM